MITVELEQKIRAAREYGVRLLLENEFDLRGGVQLNPDLVVLARQARELMNDGMGVEEALSIVLTAENVRSVESMGR